MLAGARCTDCIRNHARAGACDAIRHLEGEPFILTARGVWSLMPHGVWINDVVSEFDLRRDIPLQWQNVVDFR